MSNELKTPIETYGQNGDQRRFTCASQTAIAQGTVLILSDPKTATASPDGATGINAKFAGIASMDKASNDNSTEVSAWENGLFTAVASQSILAGNFVATSGDGNKLMAASLAVAHSFSYIVGVAQENAVDEGSFVVRILN